MTTGIPSWSAVPLAGLQVNSVALSDDASLGVCGTSNEYGTGQFGVYCYNADGSLRWTSPVGPAASTQGVFWVAMSGNGQIAAAGGELDKSSGFLTAYASADGTLLLNASTSARVNQVALSADGGSLLAVFSDTVQLYLRNGGAFQLSSSQTLAGAYCNSCAMAQDGSAAAISITVYSATGGTSTGQVCAMAISAGQLSVSGTWNSPVGVMRVAMSASGAHWAASLHDGSCALFNRANPAVPVWHYTPSQPQLGVAYAVAITETSDARVVVAAGANLTQPAGAAGPGGYLYLVDTVMSGGSPAPRLRWGSGLAMSANPGVSLDREAQLVTATDGQPGSAGTESAGNFYLFNASTGVAAWNYPTSVMNWPMVMTPDGQHAFGGSDTGAVYFWNLQRP